MVVVTRNRSFAAEGVLVAVEGELDQSFIGDRGGFLGHEK